MGGTTQQELQPQMRLSYPQIYHSKQKTRGRNTSASPFLLPSDDAHWPDVAVRHLAREPGNVIYRVSPMQYKTEQKNMRSWSESK